MGLLICLLLAAVWAHAQPPIIDVHLHASAGGGASICVPPDALPEKSGSGSCAQRLSSPETDDLMMAETLRILEERNITAIASGAPARVDRWKAAGGRRIVPALSFRLPNAPPIEPLRQWLVSGRFAMLGEVTNQYNGIAPDDAAFEPYLALAEELDVPVGIHMGPGPPGAPYSGTPKYRARLSDPFLLEEVLLRHPKLRVYAMHAAWPLADAMVAMLYSHPQLYVDTGVISWAAPRLEFHRHIRRLVESGLAKRIMFGSDQMSWPGAIAMAIEGVESASFLTAEQKRDIFYGNAARFFRLNAPGK